MKGNIIFFHHLYYTDFAGQFDRGLIADIFLLGANINMKPISKADKNIAFYIAIISSAVEMLLKALFVLLYFYGAKLIAVFTKHCKTD